MPVSEQQKALCLSSPVPVQLFPQGRGGGAGADFCGDLSFHLPVILSASRRLSERRAGGGGGVRPVLLLVSFPHSRSPVIGVVGLC